MAPEKTAPHRRSGCRRWLGAGRTRRSTSPATTRTRISTPTPNNEPDEGGTAVTDGNFLATADLTRRRRTAANQRSRGAEPVLPEQRHSRHPVPARLQRGRGQLPGRQLRQRRRGQRSGRAEAQDGGGTDNANFATPPDGRGRGCRCSCGRARDARSRRQFGGHGAYNARRAPPSGRRSGRRESRAMSSSPTSHRSRWLPASRAARRGQDRADRPGHLRLRLQGIERAARRGDRGVSSRTTGRTAIFTMGGADASIRIPSVMISQNDGAALKTIPSANVTREAAAAAADRRRRSTPTSSTTSTATVSAGG